MKVLDLFAGTGSSTRAFEDRGHEVFRVELDPSLPADLHRDVMDTEPADILGPWDFIWASPPCTHFSMAAISKHFMVVDGVYEPRHSEAFRSVELVEHTDYLIRALRPKAAIIENPRALLRKLPVVANHDRTTVWYCAYGDRAAKPTDLWLYGEAKRFHFRPECRNGNPNCHHERAPRGSKTGTQGKANAGERGMVPYELSLDICLQMEAMVEGRLEPGRLA